MVKVSVDKKKCIGCGSCVALCDNFELIEGKARVKNPNPKTVGCNKKAKDSCPTNAIKIK
ncbi:ferredoxin [Candidatus Woesearchaeota archaeon]|jgi:ferredoxin|nr:ferredoxin [Candidatus Woesearchaeota archaeon]MBT4321586.1 ferredoxin [Candidatus Woesearchaeota archaeon]MBT4631103.1 ferredoxin [Candidatus Woesearchaeota archaeon]